MREFFEDCVIPLIEMIMLFSMVLGSLFGTKAMFSYKECKVWGGKYNIYTGCLMEYDDKTLTLDDYKRIQAREITQPITHNIKIKGGEE